MKRNLTQRWIQTYIRNLLLIVLYFLAFASYADINDSGTKMNWGYKGNNGPARWGQLNPAFIMCAKGRLQSPINITKKVKNIPSTLVINYQPASATIEYDGKTNLVINNLQTIINDGHSVQLNFSQDDQTKESIQFNGKNYHLVQFHFHSPSENEWHNQNFPLEIHFVHQSDDGQVAVIGVFVRGGTGNPELEKIINHFPKDKSVEHPLQGERINPIDLLPVNHDYYSFMGSLTTPPCTEGLQWVVMATPITASPTQILLLRKEIGGTNARSVQPLNKRVINYSSVAK